LAGTVTTDLVFFDGVTGGSISNCDQNTDWVVAPTADSVTFIQGAASLTAKVSKATYTSLFTIVSNVNLTNKQIYVWMNAAAPANLNSMAGGGLRIRVEDAAANWASWYVAGSDTYVGGWECFTAHMGTTPTAKSATAPNYAAITKAGVVCQDLVGSAKENFWFDAMRYGTGVTIYGGTSGDPAVLANIVTTENLIANKWGVVVQYEGILLLQGKLQIGTTSPGVATYFLDKTSKVIIFRSKTVPTGFYEVLLQGNSTATTKVYFGETVGGVGFSGGAVRSGGASLFKFTATNQYITDLGLYGVSFYKADTIALPTYSATRNMLSCSFEQCAEVLPDTCKVQYCNFVNPTSRGIRFSIISHNVTDCTFINCPCGVHCNVAGEFAFNSLMFYGSDGVTKYDTENSVVATNCDPYADQDTTRPIGNGTITGVGQSFTGNGGTLANVSFFLSKTGVPTGNAVAKLYAHEGAYGIDSIPSGAALITSENLDVSAITGSLVDTRLDFLNEVVLTNAVKYVVTLEYDNGDVGNYINIGDDTSAPAHGGNACDKTGTWAAVPGSDLKFYVRTGGRVKASATNGSNPTYAYTLESGSPPGTTIISNDVDVVISVVNAANQPIQSAQVRVERISDGFAILDEATTVSGIADATINYPGSDIDVSVVVRKSTTGTRYYPVRTPTKVKSSGLAATIALTEDTIVGT